MDDHPADASGLPEAGPDKGSHAERCRCALRKLGELLAGPLKHVGEA